jgi:hypothetical protein
MRCPPSACNPLMPRRMLLIGSGELRRSGLFDRSIEHMKTGSSGRSRETRFLATSASFSMEIGGTASGMGFTIRTRFMRSGRTSSTTCLIGAPDLGVPRVALWSSSIQTTCDGYNAGLRAESWSQTGRLGEKVHR